jgi:hypothetical protein
MNKTGKFSCISAVSILSAFITLANPALAGCLDAIRSRADGCSVPSGVSPITAFTEACNRHDICYATPGQTKARCDTAFYDAMSRVNTGECKSIKVIRGGIIIPSNEPNLLCASAAIAYYTAVVNFGQNAYNDGQEAVRRSCPGDTYRQETVNELFPNRY